MSMNLLLPKFPVSQRISLVQEIHKYERVTFAQMEGPGCIKHIWLTMTRSDMLNRQCIIRIYFDDETIPYVETPVGDFFGVMHGKIWYPVNTPFISIEAESGYNCYFTMPFSNSARIEFEAGDIDTNIFLMVDWHQYPAQAMEEPRRFCTRWRREMPTQRYAEDYLMLDADGPGELLGFFYGVRLIDNTDRWSHGGSDNIYIDGDGEYPAYLRGIGGEDTFGTSYGGAIHPPETHLYTGMPYYLHEDVGEARPAQRVVGYRFFEHDSISFRKSIHMRFGSMCNDICSTVYWYQENPVRSFFKMPEWSLLMPGTKLPKGSCDLPIPETGEWWLCGPFYNKDNRAMCRVLPAELEFQPDRIYDGMHEESSYWLTTLSRELGRDAAKWIKRPSLHGFIDFRHVFRPCQRGVSPTESGVALARCLMNVPGNTSVIMQIAWDDHLIVRVDSEIFEMGEHTSFKAEKLKLNLTAGTHEIIVKLSNDIGFSHGGWAFSFIAFTENGIVLVPCAE